MGSKQTAIALLLVSLGTGSGGKSAQADIVWYTDRPAWNVAVGALSFTEDFEDFSRVSFFDTPFHVNPVALNGMSIVQEGTSAFRNHVDVPFFTHPDNNGTSHASMFVNSGEVQVRITFAARNRAFGGESIGAADAEMVRMEVFDGGLLRGSHVLPDGLGFLGYMLTGSDSATSVRFVPNMTIPGALGEGFSYDNLAGVNTVSAVPEPVPSTLLVIGLAAVVSMVRARARKSVDL